MKARELSGKIRKLVIFLCGNQFNLGKVLFVWRIFFIADILLNMSDLKMTVAV